MRKLPGGSFFVAAAVYLAVTKPPDLITLLAIIGCAVIAGLSVTRYSHWSITGGAMLTAGSLFLQSALSYRCTDCLRADMMILAGIITLSVVQWGRLKTAVRTLASLMTVMMPAAVILYTSLAGVAGAERVLPVEKVGRYIMVTGDGGDVSLDTADKPVLFYSPTCGACSEAVKTLAKLDPEGKLWVPVQTMGDPSKGGEYLKAKGFVGESFYFDWGGPVPAMVVTRDNKTVEVIDPEEMLRVVGGDVR
ncbi:MAG: hypothetical protein ACOY40_04745 [Bacillota bacterium]